MFSYLRIFSSSHIFSSLHPHICSSSHLFIFTSSSPPILIPSHLHIFSWSHLHIFSSSHPHILKSSHLHIFTSSHHILTSYHLHIFTFSPALLPSCSLLLFYFSLEGAGQCQRDATKCNPFARNEVRSPKNWSKIASSGVQSQPFRTKWGSIAFPIFQELNGAKFKQWKVATTSSTWSLTTTFWHNIIFGNQFLSTFCSGRW